MSNEYYTRLTFSLTIIVRRFDSAWALSGPIEKCNLTFQLWWLLAEATRHANFLVYENLREMSAYWNLMNKFFTITTEGTAFLPNCWLEHPITCLIPLCILSTNHLVIEFNHFFTVCQKCLLFVPTGSPSCVTNTCICVYSDDQYPQRNKIFAQYANRCGLVNEHITISI